MASGRHTAPPPLGTLFLDWKRPRSVPFPCLKAPSEAWIAPEPSGPPSPPNSVLREASQSPTVAAGAGHPMRSQSAAAWRGGGARRPRSRGPGPTEAVGEGADVGTRRGGSLARRSLRAPNSQSTEPTLALASRDSALAVSPSAAVWKSELS